MSEAILACRNLKKTYQGPTPVPVLLGVDLDVFPGERVAIMGRSGSGKSTLLHLLGGLDTPSAGTVLVRGRALFSLSEAERGEVRNRTLGFIYQFHHLLMEFTAAENVGMPLFIRRVQKELALEQARQLLSEVGLGARLGPRRPRRPRARAEGRHPARGALTWFSWKSCCSCCCARSRSAGLRAASACPIRSRWSSAAACSASFPGCRSSTSIRSFCWSWCCRRSSTRRRC